MVVVISTCESYRRGGGRVAVRLELRPRGRQSRGTTRAHKLLVHVPAALWKCWDPSYWWTYQRHCEMLGLEILVGVPAALSERWAQRVRRQSGHLRWQPTRELVGRVTVVVSGNPAVFFNTAGTPVQVSKELYMVSARLVLRPAWLDFVFALFPLLPLLFFPRRFCSSARSLPPIASGVSFTSAFLGRLFVVANMGQFSTSTTWTMARHVDARRRWV